MNFSVRANAIVLLIACANLAGLLLIVLLVINARSPFVLPLARLA